jgi:hypothetical protein
MEWAWKNLAESLAVPATLGMKLFFSPEKSRENGSPFTKPAKYL